ncbi:MAG: hypothetical protein IPP94_04095 [Ignavibacteria bacterium]|nr:hypothetical protein [Ignavibacteria bacterium]
MYRKHATILLSAFAATVLLFAGCSKDNPTEANLTDEEFFNYIATGQDANSQDLFSTDQDALDESAQLKALIPGLKKQGLTPITPIRYGRRIESVSRSIIRPITKQGDSIAIAEVQVVFTGKFLIQALSGVDTVIVQKPYTETIHRSVRFERIANTNRPRLNWRLDGVSILNGGTANPVLSITSVEVVTPSQTFLVTDPDAYWMQIDRWWLRHMPVLNNVAVTVRVTVQSAQPDSDIVTLHKQPGTFGLHHEPFLLVSSTPNGTGYARVYEKSWTISGKARKFAHFMVSATTRESLYDNATTNFSSVVWGIPYKPAE